MLPLNRFISFIEFNKLFKPEEKVLLAISGGKDSVLMAHLFNDARFSFGIAHCNFELRADESDGDEIFCKQLAEKLNVPFYHTRFQTEILAKQQGLSIQMAARELRYNWFESIRANEGFDYIAVAHHQSDITETVLLNLVRGTGIAGLHGILPKRGKLIRPLLFLRRDEIDEIAGEENLAYREDRSNSSVKYARNKLRLEVIPKLKELNPFLDQTFESNSRRFKELEDFLNNQVETLREGLFRITPSGDIYIDLDKLRKLQPQKLLLYEIFKPYHFTEAVLEDLVKSWNGQAGKIFESTTHRLLLDRHELILSKLQETSLPEILIDEKTSSCVWGTRRFEIKESDAIGLEISASSDTAFFDAALLLFPLKLRHWNKGDYFYPLGMKGKKKLSDFYTGLKLPLTAKNSVPVLENGNGDILWIAGYRSDERYKVSRLSKKVIIFEMQTCHDNKTCFY